MSLWQRYKALSPNTRALIGLGTMAYCIGALYVTDGAEKALGLEATEEDRQRLREALPRLVVVEKGAVSGEREER